MSTEALQDVLKSFCKIHFKGITEIMSQEKVELKQKEKQNMKKIVKKRKRNAIVAGICTAAVAAAFIVWISFSAYKNYQEAKSEDTSVPSYALDLSALTDYSQSMESSASD